MHRLIAILCLGLMACAPKVTPDGSVYRAAADPIYSNAVFDLAQVEGRWDQVAGFGIGPKTDCKAGGASFSPKGGTMRVSYQLCLSGQNVKGAGAIMPTGPGRFDVSGKGGIGQDWWVIWVDEGYRTMAIGTPSGKFGFILNRGTVLPADRLAAAREVLDFNGYDIEKLVVYAK